MLRAANIASCERCKCYHIYTYMHSGEYHGHWRGTPHFVCPELNKFKNSRKPVVLKHGQMIDVYAMGVTMLDMVPRLNRRNVWERNFGDLLTQMTHPQPEQRPNVVEIKSRISTLHESGDAFGILPMSKRALTMINNVFTAYERRRKHRHDKHR